MTATPGDSGFDPEEGAEDAAGAAYKRYIGWQTALVMAVMFCEILLDIASVLLLAAAMKYVPPVAVGFLASFLIATIAADVVMSRRRSRARKARRKLAGGDRTVAFLDDLRQQSARLKAEQRLAARIRHGKWWLALGIRLVYTTCAAIVFSAWWGPAAGIPAAVALAAVSVTVGRYGRRRAGVWADGVMFLDPRPPRDSPEV